jgi:HD-GYP domain-containing protein (c-di-GMP phosphodiesterase class II)
MSSHIPIRVATLRGDQKIDFNVFLKINDKFVLYLRQGDSFEGERLTRLRSKKLKKLFIDPKHEDLYRAYLSRNIEMAYDPKSGKDLETRASVVQGIQQANAEAVIENPGDEYNYNEAKIGALQFADFILQEQAALSSILKLDNGDQSIAQHGVAVASLAISLAQKQGQTDRKRNQMLVLGCLLHDLEHFYSTVAINRPLYTMEKEELETYKQHPISGAARVQDKSHFDQTVLNIIGQHEECIDGSGFPSGLKEKDIDPQAIIAGTANIVDRLLHFENVDAAKIPKILMTEKIGRYPLDHLKLMCELIPGLKLES